MTPYENEIKRRKSEIEQLKISEDEKLKLKEEMANKYLLEKERNSKLESKLVSNEVTSFV